MDVAAVPTTGPRLSASLTGVRSEVIEQTATALGISPGRLRTELEAGTPLSHIAALATTSLQLPRADVEPHVVDVEL